jgi:hypothetical protein
VQDNNGLPLGSGGVLKSADGNCMVDLTSLGNSHHVLTRGGGDQHSAAPIPT